jgi:hypothetical protein
MHKIVVGIPDGHPIAARMKKSITLEQKRIEAMSTTMNDSAMSA